MTYRKPTTRSLSATEIEKLERFERLVKGDYIGDYNFAQRKLKGGSSSSLSSPSLPSSYSVVDTSYVDKMISENISQPEAEEFLKTKERENRKKLARLSNLIHPLN